MADKTGQRSQLFMLNLSMWVTVYLKVIHWILLVYFHYYVDPWYLDVGERLLASLNALTRVSGGYASVRDVTTMELEDHQHSFFLSETWGQFDAIMHVLIGHEPLKSMIIQ